MKIYNSYSEASEQARKMAMETQQTVKIVRDPNGWCISSGIQNTEAGSDDTKKGISIEEAFLREKGDYVDFDKEPF